MSTPEEVESQSRVERGTIVAGIIGLAVAGNGSDDTGGNGDFADSAIRVIREVDVAGGVHCHARRIGNHGAGGGTAIAAVSTLGIAGNNGGGAGLRDLQHQRLIVRHVEISGGVHCYGHWSSHQLAESVNTPAETEAPRDGVSGIGNYQVVG